MLESGTCRGAPCPWSWLGGSSCAWCPSECGCRLRPAPPREDFLSRMSCFPSECWEAFPEPSLMHWQHFSLLAGGTLRLLLKPGGCRGETTPAEGQRCWLGQHVLLPISRVSEQTPSLGGPQHSIMRTGEETLHFPARCRSLAPRERNHAPASPACNALQQRAL